MGLVMRDCLPAHFNANRSFLDMVENLGQKLSDPKIGEKTFWTAFKTISNNVELF